MSELFLQVQYPWHRFDGTVTAGKVPEKVPVTEQEQLIHKFAIENSSVTTAQVTELRYVKPHPVA